MCFLKKKELCCFFHCTVHQKQTNKNTKRRCKLYSIPCFFSCSEENLFLLFVGLTGHGADYVHESLDLTFVERETTEGLGGTSGLRCLKPVRGSDP